MSPLTLYELKAKLERLDGIALLELLGVTSEDLVEAFTLRIEERIEQLEKEIDDYE